MSLHTYQVSKIGNKSRLGHSEAGAKIKLKFDGFRSKKLENVTIHG